MSNSGSNGTSVETELKVTEGSNLNGAAVTMDEEQAAGKDGPIDAAPDKAKDGADGLKASAGTPAGAPEHKKQLRDRVEARRQELQSAMAQLEAAQGTAPPEKVLAIQTALQGLDTHLGGGWDCVGEVEALQLAQWLDGTQYLGVVAAKEQPFTPPSDLSMDADRIGATGVLDGPISLVSGQPSGVPAS